MQRERAGKLTGAEEALQTDEMAVPPMIPGAANENASQQPVRYRAAVDVAAAVLLALLTDLFLALTIIDNLPKHASRQALLKMQCPSFPSPHHVTACKSLYRTKCGLLMTSAGCTLTI